MVELERGHITYILYVHGKKGPSDEVVHSGIRLKKVQFWEAAMFTIIRTHIT